MSGETEKQISGWTVDTLHSKVIELLNERSLRFELDHKAIREALAAVDKRQDDAHQASEKLLLERFTAQGKGIDAALKAQQEAVIKAELAADKRFASVNEFRSTLADQANTLMPRLEAEAKMAAISDKLNRVDTNVTDIRGNGRGMEKMWGFILGGIGAGVGIAAFLMNALK